ncbi:MAG: type II secretion system GspH family protein [Verrucomicrobia bacterium]|nr:type II secretion system GspH family protein [Verrucomicrobiota bacterium]MBU1857272.1 type II secretion system GspH family protein [Verrucomicrobiota bacterium]
MKTVVTKNKEPGTFLNGCMGFTMLELMIAVALFGLVMAGSFGVYSMCQRMWRSTSLSMDTARMASLAIERMVYGVGKNGGLRAAASILVDTNKHNTVSINYWNTTTNSPPPANNAVNDLVSGSPDGSWRIIYSNDLEGVKFIDYAKGQRSIVMWPDTNQAASRLLICNYVLTAFASTNSVGGIAISNLIVWKKNSMFVASNQVSTFVKKRNK